MSGSYNLTLVAASYCVAVIAAYTAIYFGTRLFDMRHTARSFWLAVGAVCLGSGIWSMHFVGMSAYTMPEGMTMSFSAPLTAASWLPAVLASGLALYVITLPRVSYLAIGASAIIMGAGISTMHYGGMAAMRMEPAIEYRTDLFVLSIAIAVVASGAALVICRQVRQVPARYAVAVKAAAALVMGAAICGMHYTGMAAAIYPDGAQVAQTNMLRGQWMGVPTAIAASVFLLVSLIVAYRDLRQAERERREAERRESQIMDDAFIDSTTGLANRARFDQRLIGELAGTRDSFAVVYLEMQGFRELSGEQGEDAGRELARHFALALANAVPESIALARYTSASFAALVPTLGEDRLGRLISDLKQAIRGYSLAPRYGHWSLGYSLYPDSATNSRLLIRVAQRPDYAISYNEQDDDHLAIA